MIVRLFPFVEREKSQVCGEEEFQGARVNCIMECMDTEYRHGYGRGIAFDLVLHMYSSEGVAGSFWFDPYLPRRGLFLLRDFYFCISSSLLLFLRLNHPPRSTRAFLNPTFSIAEIYTYRVSCATSCVSGIQLQLDLEKACPERRCLIPRSQRNGGEYIEISFLGTARVL